MQLIKFECESITPMFMYGADGSTPELRPASIKGVLRFWWRAIHGNLGLEKLHGLHGLHEREGEIFGSTDKRSKVIIYPVEITKIEDFKISPTPHHKKGYCSATRQNCYSFNETTQLCKKATLKTAKLYTFTIEMMVKKNDYMNEEQLKNIFVLATVLGGFGQRSRRGFGSIQTDNGNALSTKNGIEELIRTINEKFSYTHKAKNGDEEYPHIRQQIEIGKTYPTYQSLLEAIGQASHTYDCNELGYAKKEGRLASPIYVSAIKDNDGYKPIITTLTKTNTALESFKKAIL